MGCFSDQLAFSSRVNLELYRSFFTILNMMRRPLFFLLISWNNFLRSKKCQRPLNFYFEKSEKLHVWKLWGNVWNYLRFLPSLW